ncbi:hypothetical protein E2320_020028, partial [Naja naja]
EEPGRVDRGDFVNSLGSHTAQPVHSLSAFRFCHPKKMQWVLISTLLTIPYTQQVRHQARGSSKETVEKVQRTVNCISAKSYVTGLADAHLCQAAILG